MFLAMQFRFMHFVFVCKLKISKIVAMHITTPFETLCPRGLTDQTLVWQATVGGVIGVEFPAAERDLEDELRPEEHITAWGLAALMQNGFPPPGILQVTSHSSCLNLYGHQMEHALFRTG